MVIVMQPGRFGAAFTPTDIAGCTGWWDASVAGDFTYSSGTLVSQWNDKSGNAWHLTQGTAGWLPTRNTTINGLDAVTFDGTDDLLESASTHQVVNSSSGNWSAFAVFKKSANSGTDCVVSSVPSGNFGAQMIRTNGTTAEAVANNNATYTTDTGGTVGTSTAHQASAVQASGTIEIWLDASSGGSTAKSGANTAVSYTTMGAIANPSEIAGSYFAGIICEVILYNSALSTTDRQSVESYLRSKWGTP